MLREIMVQELSGIPSWYVAWDTNMVFQAAEGMKKLVITGFNVGMWVFLGLLGVYVLFNIVRSLIG